MGTSILLKILTQNCSCLKEIQGQRVVQRLKEMLSRDCPTWGSIPYIATKPRRYGGCREMLADGSLKWLSPERLCQSLTKIEAEESCYSARFCFYPFSLVYMCICLCMFYALRVHGLSEVKEVLDSQELQFQSHCDPLDINPGN